MSAPGTPGTRRWCLRAKPGSDIPTQHKRRCLLVKIQQDSGTFVSSGTEALSHNQKPPQKKQRSTGWNLEILVNNTELRNPITMMADFPVLVGGGGGVKIPHQWKRWQHSPLKTALGAKVRGDGCTRTGSLWLCQEEGKSKNMPWVHTAEICDHNNAICQLEVKAGRARFLSHAVTWPYVTRTDGPNSSKTPRSLQHISEDNPEARCKHTHRLWRLFTYYVLPFKKGTLVSLCPLEEPGWAGLRVTCLTPQPGEQEEEWKEEGGKQEVEEKQLEGDNARSSPLKLGEATDIRKQGWVDS